MEKYTITEKQLKDIAESCFQLGVDYSVIQINLMSNMNINKDVFLAEIDHAGAAMNDIIIKEIVKTPEHYNIARKKYSPKLFSE